MIRNQMAKIFRLNVLKTFMASYYWDVCSNIVLFGSLTHCIDVREVLRVEIILNSLLSLVKIIVPKLLSI